MYYSILRPLLLTVLASLPASLVFNLLSFGNLCSTRCLYRNNFLFSFFASLSLSISIFFFLFLFGSFLFATISLLHHAVCVRPLRSVFRRRSRASIARRIAPIAITRGPVRTLRLISTFPAAGALINRASLHTPSRALGGTCPFRRCVARPRESHSCSRDSLLSCDYLPLRARESRQARGPL